MNPSESIAAGVGKIGRLPAALRREVCRRLSDHEPASKIISWLKDQPHAIEIWAEHFSGAQATPQNISEFKKSAEYRQWIKNAEDVDAARGKMEWSVKMAQAAGGISQGAVAALGGAIHDLIENGADAETVGDLVKMATALRVAEQNDTRLALMRRRAEQIDRQIALDEVRVRRQTAELFLAWFADRQARDIASGKADKSVKVDSLVKLFFGDRPADLAPVPSAKG